VSILITIGDAGGRWRGEEPRANVSIMIMRPPQHGHGCASGFGSLEVVVSAVGASNTAVQNSFYLVEL